MQLTQEQIKLLRRGIIKVWSAISSDLCGEPETNEEALELCFDCDRLHEADAQACAVWTALLISMPYDAALQQVSKAISLV